MIFKTIEKEASVSGLKIVSIFSGISNQIRTIFSKSYGGNISFSSEFTTSLRRDIDAIEEYKRAVKERVSTEEAFALHMRESSATAKEYVQSTNSANINIDDYIKKAKKAEIATIAQNKALTNVRSIINTYNDGLDTLGLNQEQFAASVGEGNVALGKYLSGLNGSKGSMVGYIVSLVGAKAATIGLQVATTALNMALTMGISLLVSGLFKVISEAYVSADELSDKVNELTDKYKEQQNTLSTTKTRLAEIKDKYAELSKGVSDLGENIGLSTSEYDEYNDIVNEIADMFPELVQGFDSQGNAILSCKGNVDELTEAYNNMAIAANNAVISEGGNIFEDFKNFQKDNENHSFWGVGKSTTQGIDVLDAYLNNLDKSAFDEYDYKDAAKILREKGFEPKHWFSNNYTQKDFVEETIKNNKNVVRSIIDDFRNELETGISSLKSYVTAYISNEFLNNKDLNIPDNVQSLVNSIVSQFDYDFYKEFDSMDELNSYLNGLLDTFNGLSAEDSKTLTASFNLRTEFNNNKCDIGTYFDNLENAKNVIGEFDESTQEKLEILLDINGKDIEKQYKDIIKRLTAEGIDKDTAEEFARGLTKSDLESGLSEEFSLTRETALLESRNKTLREYTRLIELYKNGDITQVNAQAVELAAELGISIEELVGKYDEFTQEIDSNTEAIVKNKIAIREAQTNAFEILGSIESLSNGLDQLDKIYTDVCDGENFDFSSILNNDDFQNAFGGLGDSYTNFINTIIKNSSDINACRNAFNDLVGAYSESSGALDNVTDSTRDASVAMLKQMGVTNAAEIVDAHLAYQKVKLKYSTDEYTKATYSEIVQMFNEAEAGSMTQQSLAELALSKININKVKINTSSDIQQIIALANAANASAASIAAMTQAMNAIRQAESLTPGTAAHFHAIDSDAYKQAQQTIKNIQNGTFNYDFQGLDASDFMAPYTYTGGSSSGGSSGSSGAGSSNSGSNEPTVVDWIEKAIERIESKISKLQKSFSNTYKKITDRFASSKNAITEITKEIDLQQKAYNRYMKQADSVGLSSNLKQLVRDGAVDISEYDENTANLISDYQEWYEKALDCSDAIDELHESLASLYEERFDAISADFDNQLSMLEHKANTYENMLSLLETSGYKANANYYTALAEVEENNISILKNKYNQLQKSLQDAINSGEIAEGSEAWYSMKLEIEDVSEAIQEARISLEEYNQTLRELKWEQFDLAQDKISNLNSEAEFLIGLLSNSDLYDDKGQLTNEGMSVMGLHGAEYNTYMAQSDKYAKELLKINEELAKDPYNNDLIERREELLELQQESISAAEDEKQAMIDMVREGIEIELDALQELIDKYEESLDSAKDLYDYQKKIADYTDEINSIQKQLSAYSNDTSEESRARIQKLNQDLANAKENLEEAEYDRYISEQKKLLDNLYDEYESILNQRLDNIDALLTDLISIVNANAGTIGATIVTETGKVGYAITEAMKTIWSKPEYGTGDVDNDGEITAADARRVLKMLNGEIPEDLKTADVDGDGKITKADADLILKAAAKLSDLPINQGSITDTIIKYGDDFLEKLTSVNLALGLIEDGVYSLYNYLTGDVNGDNKITSADARLALRASAGLEDLNTRQQVLTDVNGDGIITAADARLILRKAAGLEGFAKGGIATGLKSLIRKNGDDYITVNTLKNGEAVLTPEQTAQFSKFVDNLPLLTGITDVTGRISDLRNISKVRDNHTTFGDTIINIEHVEDYDDFVKQLAANRKFEKLLESMTVGRMLGGSSLDKNKYK